MQLSPLAKLSLVGLLAFSGGNARAQSWGRGVVKGPGGAALGNVWVQELGEWRGSLSESDGAFRFPFGRMAMFLFYREGFRPEVRTTAGTESELHVTLQPDEPIEVGLCRRRGRGSLLEFKPAKMPGIAVTRGGDVDFVEYAYTYSHQQLVAVLSTMTGMHVSGLTPSPDWVKGLSSITVQSLKCDGVQWIDLRGVSHQGLESRWIGYSLGSLQYSRVPKEAAHVFDRAIAGGCCRQCCR